VIKPAVLEVEPADPVSLMRVRSWVMTLARAELRNSSIASCSRPPAARRSGCSFSTLVGKVPHRDLNEEEVRRPVGVAPGRRATQAAPLTSRAGEKTPNTRGWPAYLAGRSRVLPGGPPHNG
jgi:hypothetical protein